MSPRLKTASVDHVLRTLRAVRRRMLTQTLLVTLARAGLLLGAALVVVGVVRRTVFQVSPWDPRLAMWAVVATAVGALVLTWSRRLTMPQTAVAIDTLGQTRDRFLTALDFSRTADPDGLQAMAVEECAGFIRKEKFARLVRLRLPRELPYLVVPAIAIALLYWEARGTLGARDAQAAVARAGIEDTAKKLEDLAREAEKANEQTKSEDWKKLAEELKRSAREMREDAKTSEEAEKASLRELSQLEQLVQEMQKQQSAPTPEELREFAKALEKKEETKEAAEALNKGDLARAAESLEKAMKDLEEAGDQKTREEIEQALKEAMERVAQQQKQMSEALEKLAKQMQQQGEQGKGGQQMSKELADLLKKMQPQAGKPGQGKPLDEQSLKNLLAALQNLKFGEGQPADGKPGDGPPKGLVMMQGKDPKPGEHGDPRFPSGQPGSEKDTGTTESPFGKDQTAQAKDSQQQSVSGRLGEGETLQQFLPGVTDASKSKRRYKELYEAMAPAAEDAVVQENIPLGSRFFIKRYFESIRPKE